MYIVNQSILAFTAGTLALLITTVAWSATVIPIDYMDAGTIGDTWTYKNHDNTQFTWTLSEVASGPNAGAIQIGELSSGKVYEVVNEVLTVLELNNISIPSSWNFIFSEIELGQIVTLNDDPIDPSMYLFWSVPSVTTQACTFSDVIALVWLDDDLPPNSVNTELGLPTTVTMAVTDVDYFARGIGQIRYRSVEAVDGTIDGGFELISTTVVSVETNCTVSEPASIASNLDINIPSATYQSLDGILNIWVKLEFKGVDADGDYIWRLKDYGEKQ